MTADIISLVAVVAFVVIILHVNLVFRKIFSIVFIAAFYFFVGWTDHRQCTCRYVLRQVVARPSKWYLR